MLVFICLSLVTKLSIGREKMHFKRPLIANYRKTLDRQAFDTHYLYKLMRRLFPKRNDCASLADLDEVTQELKHFSIETRLQLRLFLKKHRRQLIEIDRAPLDKIHQRLYREQLGDTVYLDAIRRQYWFCYPALVRTALEIEFGDQYEQFSITRDGA